ncbi:MAG: hypothetical protein NT091_00780 [Candidatus Falkowbacteria bacterium]|nr:hypothetical protein [Candidatus Falkowbacteria bacterium]
MNSAEQTYKKQIELEPDSPTPYLRLGLVNMARAREAAGAEEKKLHISESIKLYNEAINRKANLASAYYGRSIAYEALGDLDNAIKDLTSATIIDQNSEYIFELGRLYLNRGVSKTALEKTKDSNLNVKEVDTTSGTIKKNADLSTAEQLFLSILLKNQDNANARYRSLLRVIQDEKQKEQIKQEFPGLF